MKKHFILSILLAVGMTVVAQTPWNGSVADAYDGGDGTPENPYQIATAEQLALLSQQTNNGTGGDASYILTSDIILNDGDSLLWTPIGNVGSFVGIFDGNNHIISGLYEDGNKISGLFASTENAVIKNTVLEKATVLEYEQAYVYSAIGGILVGKAKNTHILNCSVDGMIEVFSAKPSGGLVGQCEVDVNDTVFIKDCVNYASVTENECTGGMVGKTIVNNGNLVVDNCANHGYISGWTFAGGMVGDGDFIITNCDNYGVIVSEGTAGGLAGQGGHDCKITYCFNHESGNVTGGMNTGGIIGTAIFTTMSCCGNAALLTGINDDEIMMGGISGADGTIYNCFNRGDLTAVFTCEEPEEPLLIQMGGITSTPPHDECVRNVYNAGAIVKPSNPTIMSEWYGHIVPAIFSDTLISDCYWTGNESITTYVYDLGVNSWVHIPSSCVFNPGATATTWVLDETLHGTTDLLEALNAGAMGQCVWVEDIEGINAGLPIPRPMGYENVKECPVTNLVVYPNPTNGILFVETHGRASQRTDQSYRITNLMGQILRIGSIMGDSQSLDVSALPAGMYLLTIDGATVKFVVK
ncbi:MAG: T9SS type A sorting domain-containing protein [Bacteroidales bacterium]|nr:T9SS type A sorting domain-containing protein [Bacteroidales bacterium]